MQFIESRKFVLQAYESLRPLLRDLKTSGNVSEMVDDPGAPAGTWRVAITASGSVESEDAIVLIDQDGVRLEGRREPSSEKNLHLSILREKLVMPFTGKPVRAVAHMHGEACKAVAMSRLQGLPAIDCLLFLLGVNASSTIVPKVPFAAPGTDNLARIAGERMSACECIAAFLPYHGAVVAGSCAEEAAGYALMLESICRSYLMARAAFGEVKPMTPRMMRDTWAAFVEYFKKKAMQS